MSLICSVFVKPPHDRLLSTSDLFLALYEVFLSVVTFLDSVHGLTHPCLLGHEVNYSTAPFGRMSTAAVHRASLHSLFLLLSRSLAYTISCFCLLCLLISSFRIAKARHSRSTLSLSLFLSHPPLSIQRHAFFLAFYGAPQARIHDCSALSVHNQIY